METLNCVYFSISKDEKTGRILVKSVDVSKIEALADEQTGNKKRKREDEKDEEEKQPPTKQSKQPTKSEANISVEV